MFNIFYFKGDPQEDGLTVVLHQQPTGGLYQSFVCELLQPCTVPRCQLTPPGALGRLLHSLEPSHETSGMSQNLLFYLLDCLLP